MAEKFDLNGPSDDDPIVAELRASLKHTAADVRPSDRFSELLDRVNDSKTRRGPGGPGGKFRLLVVAACLALLAGVSVPLLHSRLSGPDPATQTTQTTTAPPTSPQGPPSLQTLQREVPVYYVGEEGLLYREFRSLPTQTDRLTTAVAAVLNVVPQDPALSSGWSGGQVNSAKVSGNRITLDISESAFSLFKDPDSANAAIKQVVYTAIAAVGDRNGEKTVQLLMDGSPNLPVVGAPSTDFVLQGTAPLGRIWVITPASGATVKAGEVTITGTQQVSVNSPRVNWVISNRAGQQVASGSTDATGNTAGWRSWSVTTELSPGEYTIRLSSPGVRFRERSFVVS